MISENSNNSVSMRSVFLNSVFSSFLKGSSPIGSKLLEYETIIGVGDSITNGLFDLDNGQFDQEFRGVNFVSASTPGTTLQFMIDNVQNFTNLTSGKTLFIIMAGINDCNTYLSGGGVGDGASGSVTSWDDMTVVEQNSVLSNYRELHSLLSAHGDVAISAITWCDAKGQLLPLPDKGRDLHTGSWNDNSTIPLCKELTPVWFDKETNRPVIDFYTLTINNTDIIDDDNLHFYSDYVYSTTEVGYPNAQGSYTLRDYLVNAVASNTTLPSKPYDESTYEDRVIFNIGRGSSLRGRPSFQRYANNLEASTNNETYLNVKSYNSETSPYGLSVNFTSNGSLRSNLFTSQQPWSEGVDERNIASGGISARDSHNHVYTVTGLGGKKGKLNVLGLYVAEGAGSVHDPNQETIFRITDDSGDHNIKVPSSIDGITVNLADCIGTFDFDCTLIGELIIKVLSGPNTNYGVMSGFHIDIAK